MLIHVHLSQIDDNPFQRRSEYGDIADLAARIEAALPSYPGSFGLMQIPRGRLMFQSALEQETIQDIDKYNTDGILYNDKAIRVQLAFGHCRLRAFRFLQERAQRQAVSAEAAALDASRQRTTSEELHQWDYFPVHVDPLTDDQMLNAVWSENRERKDISAIEEAELLQIKLERLGKQAAVAAEWGLARSTIANRLRLLDLPEDIQAANRAGQLSERQCLALKPVIEIDALVNGRVEWGSNINQSWGMPAGAGKVIEAVLENPNNFTSDQLRQHAKYMANNAGRLLPDCIATHNYGQMPGIEQPQCKGCRFRYDQRCLDKACLAHKQEVWIEVALDTFSQESGIPISDRAEDFTDDYDTARHIKKLYEAGVIDSMVCAWQEESPAARPFTVHGYGDFSEGGRAGIALGWRGELPPLPETPSDEAAPRYDMPLPDEIAAWDKEETKIAAAARRELLAAVTDALIYQVAEFDVIQTLMNPADAERADEAGKLAKQFAKFLLDKGKRITWSNTVYEEVAAYQSAADCAGLDISVLGNEKETARKTAVLILSHWYDRHGGYFWEREGNEALERIEQWLQLPAAATSSMAEHINRAKQHIQQKIEAEGETS